MFKSRDITSIVGLLHWISYLSYGFYFKANYKTAYDAKPDFEKSKDDNSASKLSRQTRRSFLSTGTFLIVSAPTIANAGEVGARITQAVTTSDLGVQVRKSVVKGAQLMDQLDGSWEKFSDNYNLGSERSKREGRPKARMIPERKSLNAELARTFLDTADQAFLSLMPPSVNKDQLQERINITNDLVKRSFERSGLSMNYQQQQITADQFNYLCYIHFRSYSDIILKDRSIAFPQFKNKFDEILGDRLLAYFSLSNSTTENYLKKAFHESMCNIDGLLQELMQNGLIASFEKSEIVDEKIQDWSDDLSELQFTIGVDGDATLQAQILLQEQGYRLYPDFSRFLVASYLSKQLRRFNQSVLLDEYYMDTDYNSDPDKFEVKQVLLNIVIDSTY